MEKPGTESIIVIKSRSRWWLVDFEELWRFRELVLIFVWRDIKVRYKQTFLGVAWVIFQPIVSTGIFTVFFGKIAKIPSDNIPYQLFALIGLVIWIFFSSSLTQGANSMVENLNVIKKVYFPREILPISAAITGLVDFAINFVIVIIATFLFGFTPSLFIFFILPISLVIILLTSSGLGLFLASINVKYRDVRFILPFFIQMMLFLTPVIYPMSTVRNFLRPFVAINPIAGVVEAMRKVIVGSHNIDYGLLGISLVSSFLLLLIGLFYFRMTERYFADIA